MNYIGNHYYGNSMPTDKKIEYIAFYVSGVNESSEKYLVQIEEGTTATSYEPYKETNATIYLNSPLLKGDRIEVVDGRLCHYHRCCLKVLNGSESWFKSPSATTENMLSMGLGNISDIQNIICCDKYIKGSSSVLNSIRPDNTLPGIRINISSDKLPKKPLDMSPTEFSQWLSENPIIVVYELKEPYYEDITPLQSQFIMKTLEEGNMEILTNLPIKTNISYNTNLYNTTSLEEELNVATMNSTNLTNLLEDEINN